MPSQRISAKQAKPKTRFLESKKSSKTAQPAVNGLSTEYIQESDEGNEAPAEESQSEGDFLPADPTDHGGKLNGKMPAPDGSESSSENESDSQHSEGTGSKEEEDEEDSSVEEKTQVAVEPTKKPATEPSRTVSSEAPAPFKAPAGFQPTPIDETPTISRIINKSNLKGKQVWYFTAPASVPLSSLQKMSLRDVRKGKKILSYKGNEYGFVQDSSNDKTSTKIMVPNISDNGYRTTSKSIDQILHLQQIIDIPGVNSSSTNNAAVSATATVPAKKPVRPQPAGLKMRFRPIGFGSGETGTIGSEESGSDDEMAEISQQFQKPARVDSDGDDEMTEAPPLPLRTSSTSTKLKHEKSSKHASKDSLKRKHKEGGEKKSKQSKKDRTTDSAKETIKID